MSQHNDKTMPHLMSVVSGATVTPKQANGGIGSSKNAPAQYGVPSTSVSITDLEAKAASRKAYRSADFRVQEVQAAFSETAAEVAQLRETVATQGSKIQNLTDINTQMSARVTGVEATLTRLLKLVEAILDTPEREAVVYQPPLLPTPVPVQTRPKANVPTPPPAWSGSHCVPSPQGGSRLSGPQLEQSLRADASTFSHPPPLFSYTRSGEDHTPHHECQIKYRDITTVGVSGSKAHAQMAAGRNWLAEFCRLRLMYDIEPHPGPNKYTTSGGGGSTTDTSGTALYFLNNDGVPQNVIFQATEAAVISAISITIACTANFDGVLPPADPTNMLTAYAAVMTQPPEGFGTDFDIDMNNNELNFVQTGACRAFQPNWMSTLTPGVGEGPANVFATGNGFISSSNQPINTCCNLDLELDTPLFLTAGQILYLSIGTRGSTATVGYLYAVDISYSSFFNARTLPFTMGPTATVASGTVQILQTPTKVATLGALNNLQSLLLDITPTESLGMPFAVWCWIDSQINPTAAFPLTMSTTATNISVFQTGPGVPLQSITMNQFNGTSVSTQSALYMMSDPASLLAYITVRLQTVEKNPGPKTVKVGKMRFGAPPTVMVRGDGIPGQTPAPEVTKHAEPEPLIVPEDPEPLNPTTQTTTTKVPAHERLVNAVGTLSPDKQSKNKFERAFVGWLARLPCSNYFLPLINDVQEAAPSDGTLNLREPHDGVGPRKEARGKDKQGGFQLVNEQERRSRQAPTAEKKKLTPDEARAQGESVLERLSKKFLTDPFHMARWLNYKRPLTSWASEVATWMWGTNWAAAKTIDTQRWIMYCYVHSIPDYDRLYTICQTVPRLRNWIDKTSVDEVCTIFEIRPPLPPAEDGYTQAQACAHNKEVHALNGNVRFPTTQTDADKGITDTATMYGTDAVSATEAAFDEYSWYELFTGLPSSQNPNITDIATATILRANTAAANNTIFTNEVLPLPNTACIPRSLRPADGGELVDADVTLPNVCFSPTSYYAQQLVPTKEAANVVAAADALTKNLARKDNTSIMGFYAADLPKIVNQAAHRGFCPQSIALKATLLAHYLTYNTTTTNTTVTEFSQIDTNTSPVAAGNVLSYNDSAVFDEDCGGTVNPPVPFFPCAGEVPIPGQLNGATGTLSFFINLRAIPASEPYWVIPQGILEVTDDPQVALALLIMLLSEFPAVMPTVAVATVDIDGANQEYQDYIPAMGYTRIPGPRNLNILLPREETSTNPVTQQQANDRVYMQPMSGPIATSTIAADAPLNVSFRGPNGLTQYRLVDYIYGWFGSFGIETLRSLLSSLSHYFQMTPFLEQARELICFHSVLYPAMNVSTADDDQVFAVGSAQQAAVSSAAGVRYSPLGQNYPVPPGDYFAGVPFYELDFVAWNKVVLSLATAPNAPASPGEILPYWLTMRQANSTILLRSMTMAATMQTHFNNLGLTAQAWNTAFTQTGQSSTNPMVISHFARPGTTHQAAHPKSQMSTALSNLYHKTIGSRLQYLQDGRQVNVTVFDTIYPPKSQTWSVSAIVVGGVTTQMTNLPPHTLCDTWVRFFSKDVPLSIMAFPPPGGVDGTAGYSGADMCSIQLNNNTATGLVSTKWQQNYLRTNAIRLEDEKTKWNMRMIRWFANGVIMNYQSGAVPNVPPATYYPTQRPVVLSNVWFPGFVQADPTLRLTEIMAMADSNGQTLWVWAAPNLVQNVQQAQMRRNRLANPAWLINDVLPHATNPSADDVIDSAWTKLWVTVKVDTAKDDTANLNNKPGGKGGTPADNSPAAEMIKAALQQKQED